MGTDIHIYLEYRSRKTKHYQYGGELHGERCYGLFNTMSGCEVRGEKESLYPVRGLPGDVTQATYKEYKEWEGDAHHASWLTQPINKARDLHRPLASQITTQNMKHTMKHKFY